MKINEEFFDQVLQEVKDQVFGKTGKGYIRHGQGASLDRQSWMFISENVGDGFCLGQSLKKLMELKVMDPKGFSGEEKEKRFLAWKKELLGAIVYAVFAMMYKTQETKQND